MKRSLVAVVGIGLAVATLVAGGAWWRHAGGFELDVCEEGGHLSLLDTLSTRYDYVALRNTHGEQGPDERGTRCDGAKDRPACEAKVSEATTTAGWSGSHGRMPGRNFIVATRGDEVFIIDDAAMTVEAALAPIDTAVKAALVASHRRGTPIDSCRHSARKTEQGFEVHLSTDSCFGPRDEIIAVDADGKLDVKSSWSGKQTCVGALAPRGPTCG